MADKTEKKLGFFASIGAFFSGIAKYLRDTRSEMNKVVWPSKKQIINNTLIVLAVVALSSVLIFGLDSLFGWLLKLIIQKA